MSNTVVLGEEGLDVIGLELGVRLEVVVLDKPVSHLGILPGGRDGVWKPVPVLFEELLKSVALVGGGISLGDDLVLDEIRSSLGVGPGVPDLAMELRVETSSVNTGRVGQASLHDDSLCHWRCTSSF